MEKQDLIMQIKICKFTYNSCYRLMALSHDERAMYNCKTHGNKTNHNIFTALADVY